MSGAVERVQKYVDFYAAALAGEYNGSRVIDHSTIHADLLTLIKDAERGTTDDRIEALAKDIARIAEGPEAGWGMYADLVRAHLGKVYR